MSGGCFTKPLPPLKRMGRPTDDHTAARSVENWLPIERELGIKRELSHIRNEIGLVKQGDKNYEEPEYEPGFYKAVTDPPEFRRFLKQLPPRRQNTAVSYEDALALRQLEADKEMVKMLDDSAAADEDEAPAAEPAPEEGS